MGIKIEINNLPAIKRLAGVYYAVIHRVSAPGAPGVLCRRGFPARICRRWRGDTRSHLKWQHW